MKALLLGLVLATTGLGEDRTVLLLDDHDNLCRAGTRRVLEKPLRHPPILPTETNLSP